MKLFMTPEDIAAKETARLAGREKCSSCGQPIPDDEPSCPNCGRKRKSALSAAALSARQAKASKPIIAQICTVMGCVAIVFGGIGLVGGLVDSAGLHPSGGGETMFGAILLTSGIVWLALGAVIALLAQIELNTRRSS
jgi:hypothetical protein